MAVISAELVKELRARTGAGMMDCKRALDETGGDMERAVVWLREKGLATAAKKAGRVAAEGLVHAYIHAGGRIGVLVEVNCETDFVARTEEFRSFAHDVALQVAAAAPRYVAREDVPPEEVEGERRILRARTLEEGKPPQVVDRIVEGRLEKQFFAQVCLLEQPFIKNPDVTVGRLVQETIARLGENVVVRRFARFELGETVARPGDGEAC